MGVSQIKPIIVPEPPENGGTVTRLSWQKKDPHRCSVFLDDSFAFGLHVDVVSAHGLRKGVVLSLDDCLALLQEDVYYRALKRILSHLAYKPRTEKELQDRLDRLHVDASTRKQVMEKVRSMHLVHDERYAEEFARGRLRAYGPRRVVRELIQKGIPETLAEKTVVACNPHDDPDEHMAHVTEKAWNRYRTESDPRTRSRKTIGYLVRRGYDVEEIKVALSLIAP